MSSTPTTRSQPADALSEKLKRTEIQHKQSSIPGREIVQVLTGSPVAWNQGGTPIRARRSATSWPVR